MERIKYANLNSKQKENYNFHKVAAILADYGFTSLWLNDDYLGADFIAVGVKDVMKVQLKSRFTVEKKYLGKGVHIAAPIRGNWFLYPHDAAVEFLTANGIHVKSESWTRGGGYSSAAPGKQLMTFLSAHRIDS